jgi:hypothetical protein
MRKEMETMSEMKNTETRAIREMADAALRSSVRLARWIEDVPTDKGRIHVWACGWYMEEHPDDMHHVGWRRTKEEISELCISAGLLFSKIVKPKRIRIHGPRNVN